MKPPLTNGTLTTSSLSSLTTSEVMEWDRYVRSHPACNLYQLSHWLRIIQETYRHDVYFLVCRAAPSNVSETIASRPEHELDRGNENSAWDTPATLKGVLPLVHLKSFIFGNSLVSVPFFDMGGILADDDEAESSLLLESARLREQLRASSVQLRQAYPLDSVLPPSPETGMKVHTGSTDRNGSPHISVRTHKARMILDLPSSSDLLMTSFKAKLRSQIRRPVKEGLTAKTGGVELLSDFYEVFSANMRDLGSPVHSRELIRNVLEAFPSESRLCLVYKQGAPIACGLLLGFGKTLSNPWASSLKTHSRLSPNMLLYWTMLQYGCDHGYQHFDFGRSSIDEGTYRFKEQWGAQPRTLHWYHISPNGPVLNLGEPEKSNFSLAVHLWKKLPLAVSRVLGPRIRKHIGL